MNPHENAGRPGCEYAGREDAETRYLAGRLSPAEAEAFEAHYFACDECWRRVQRAIELRKAFAAETKPQAAHPAEDAATPRRAGRRPSSVVWPIAAGVAFAALLLGVWRMTLDDGAVRRDVMRGPGESLPVSASTAADALTASWPAIAEADVYRVRLFTADGTLLAEREIREQAFTIRRGQLPQVQPGQMLYWSIEALDELRRPLARSPLTEAVSGESG